MRKQFRIRRTFFFFLIITVQTSYILFNIKQNRSTSLKDCKNGVSQCNYLDYINIGFSDFELVQFKQREMELEKNCTLTAVLLHWRRLANTVSTVNVLLDSNLFKEIIIWNNNPEITLENTMFHKNTSTLIPIRIINSKTNLRDEAKYRACMEAKTIACFYADDDWDISFYLKSLVFDFRTDPYILHSVTDPYTFYTDLIWTYFDKQIDLHAGFSWLGCGSVFLREYAVRHTHYLQTYLKNDSGKLIE